MPRNIPRRSSSLLKLLVTRALCLLTVAVVYVGVESESIGQVKNSGNELAKFQKELKRRVSKEQMARIALNKQYKQTHKNSDPEAFNKRRYKLLKKASDIDGDNLEWLKGKIIRYGIPEYPVLGVRSADHFFLLVLHADRDPKFQLSCLNVFKSENSKWPNSFADTLEYRLKLVSPDVFKKQQDDTPKTEQPEQSTELPNVDVIPNAKERVPTGTSTDGLRSPTLRK